MILADVDVVHHGSSTHPTCELTIASESTANFRLPFGKRTCVFGGSTSSYRSDRLKWLKDSLFCLSMSGQVTFGILQTISLIVFLHLDLIEFKLNVVLCKASGIVCSSWQQ